LARLHSRYWGDRLGRETALSWVDPFVAWKGMAAGIDIGLKRAGDSVPPAIQKLGGDEVEGYYWARFIDTVNDGPQTLLHGDPHIGNTYVLPDDDVGFLDWQVVRRGNYCVDLGYFLQGALTVEDRRASEAELLEAYREELELPADECPTLEQVWLRYRASVAHGLALWLATAASNTWQRPEVSMALAQRYSTAFVDLDTPSAINELTGGAE
jgi:thiamine kinase-like enzyme